MTEGGRVSDGAILLAVKQLTIDQSHILWAYLAAQLSADPAAGQLDLLVTWLDLLLLANFTQLAAANRQQQQPPGNGTAASVCPISAASLVHLSGLIGGMAELQFQQARFAALCNGLPVVAAGLSARQTSSQSAYNIVKVTLT